MIDDGVTARDKHSAFDERPTWRLRRSGAITLLALITLWPLLHLYLVKTYDLSSWKAAGWGMYATPRPESFGMEVYGRSHDAPRQHLTVVSPRLTVEAGMFLENFKWLRRLANPESFARAVLEEHPEWNRLEMEVFRSDLDPDSGRIVSKKTVFAYP